MEQDEQIYEHKRVTMTLYRDRPVLYEFRSVRRKQEGCENYEYGVLRSHPSVSVPGKSTNPTAA